MKAAPGPYEVVPVERQAFERAGEQWVMIRNEAGAIAAVYPARDAKETATLLAAAPGMLAALKDSALEFLRCAEDCAGTPNYQHFRELARIANVVVAKAEGRSESVPMSNIAVADEPVDGGPIPDAKLEDTLL